MVKTCANCTGGTPPYVRYVNKRGVILTSFADAIQHNRPKDKCVRGRRKRPTYTLIIDDDYHDGYSEAGRKLNVHPDTVKRRCFSDKWPTWTVAREPTCIRIVGNNVLYKSTAAAAVAYKTTVPNIHNRVRSDAHPNWFVEPKSHSYPLAEVVVSVGSSRATLLKIGRFRFTSYREAGYKLKMGHKAIRDRCLSDEWPTWRIVEKTKPRRVRCGDVVYKTLYEASKKTPHERHSIRNWCNNNINNWTWVD